MDLVSETVARTLGIDPGRGLPAGHERSRAPSVRSARERPAWVDEVDAPQAPAPAPTPVASAELEETEVVATPDENGLVEVPCPVCSGPLLVATTDREGVCPHCDRLLEFEVEGGSETTPLEQGEPATAPSLAYDPTSKITPASAPLIEVRAVAPLEPTLQPEEETPAAPVAAAPAEEDEPDIGTEAASDDEETADVDEQTAWAPVGPPAAVPRALSMVDPQTRITRKNAPLVEVHGGSWPDPSPRPGSDEPAAAVAAAPTKEDEPPLTTKKGRGKGADGPVGTKKKGRGTAKGKAPITKKKSGSTKSRSPAKNSRSPKSKAPSTTKKKGRSTTGVQKRS
ncbi:MAG: hypothetical protein KY455_00055 [Euryarchaeota archaeon]|nr:hypothetical protein [Euryarchaeota archaeon]